MLRPAIALNDSPATWFTLPLLPADAMWTVAGLDFADEIVIKFFDECRIDRVSRTGKQQCVTLRCRANDSLGGNIASRAHPVLNDELLPHPLRQLLPYQPSEDIGGAAG